MITEAQLITILDDLLIKFFVILFSALICSYLIVKISYRGKI